MLCSLLFVCFLSISSPPPPGRRKKEACAARIGVPSVEGLLYCSSLSMSPFWLILLDYSPSPLSQSASHRYPSWHLTAELIAMAEMADLTSALNKMEVSKKSEEGSPPASSDKPAEGGSPSPPSDKPVEEASPPATSDKPMEEASPPASSDKQEEKKSPPHREEVTHKLGGSKAEDASPPESKQLKDPADDDLLEFTSATEGEASSSAWELVPEQKIARKKGVKSDTEIDSMLKKAIKEAEQPEKAQVTSKDVTASSDASSMEADFSLEDAPTPPSKDVLTTSMGRKNLMVAGVTPEDEDSEMAEADPAAMSHLGSSTKRKGRSTSQGAAKKRALPF